MNPRSEKRQNRLCFSVLIFFVCLLFTALLWNFYFHSEKPIDRALTANLILTMGILFSASAGLFSWSLETRKEYLEAAIQKKNQELLEKSTENKRAEATAAAIYHSSHLLFSDIKFNGLLDTVMDLMNIVLRADEGSIMLLDANRELFIAASRGIPEEVARQIHIKIGESVAGRAAELRKEFLLLDGLDKYPEFRGIESNPRIRSSIVCPLVCQNELLGVLNLNRTANQTNFTVSDMINVSIFASQVAQAVRNASLYQSLERKIAELEETNRRLKVLQGQAEGS